MSFSSCNATATLPNVPYLPDLAAVLAVGCPNPEGSRQINELDNYVLWAVRSTNRTCLKLLGALGNHAVWQGEWTDKSQPLAARCAKAWHNQWHLLRSTCMAKGPSSYTHCRPYFGLQSFIILSPGSLEPGG